ncbi:MAG: hypothetical protein HPY55_03360 [Firmicutes bacterium]|nr:hypothetical protein [Bacillota bacterium]
MDGSIAIRALRTLACWVRSSATARATARSVRAIVGLGGPGAESHQPSRRDSAGGSLVVGLAVRALRPAIEVASRCLSVTLSVADESVTGATVRSLARSFERLRRTGPGGSSLAVNAAAMILDFVLNEPLASGVAFALCVLPFAPTTGLVALCVFLGGFQALRLIHAPRSHAGEARSPRGGVSDLPTALFALAVLLSAAASVSRRASMPALVLWAAYAALYTATVTLRPSKRAVKAMAAALLISAFIVSGLGIVQFIRGGETSASWIDTKVFEDVKTRVYSVFDNPNMLAEFLAFALPLGVALILGNPRSAAMLFYVPAVVAAAACLALTYSRGGWVAAFIGVVAVILTKSRKLAVAFLVLMLVAAPMLPQSIQTRAITALTMEDSSSRYRLTIWKSAARMARDYWPIGVGLGSGAFAYVYPAYEIAGTPAAHTHNLYLQLLVETGIPGLLLFLWLLLCFVREVAGAGRTRDPLIFAGLAGGVVGQVVHGVFDNIWYSPKNVFMFWAVLGLTLAMARAGRADREGRKP